MSKILNNVRAAKRIPPAPNVNSLHATSNNAVSRPRNMVRMAPMVVEIDEELTRAWPLEIDESPVEPRPAPKLDTNIIIAPASTIFASFKRFCRRVYRKLGLKHLLSIALIIFYTIFGAGAFIAIEKSSDSDRLAKEYASYLEKRRAFVRTLSVQVAELRRPMSTARMSLIIDARLSDYEKLIGYSINNETEWNFWHAMYFAGTIYTTIGYGDIYCRTTAGRLFTIIYSLIGIPIVLSVLTDLGSLLLKFLFHVTRLYNKFVAFVCPMGLCTAKIPPPDEIISNGKRRRSVKKNLEKRNSFNKTETVLEIDEESEQSVTDDKIDDLDELSGREDEEYEYQLMRVPVLVALSATVGWIFVCAALFCIWEDWPYFTSIYFFFISLSTIGLGDETPKRKDLMVSTYLLVIIGLALVSMCITVIQRRLEDLYLQLLRMILKEYQKQLQEGSDQMGATMGIMNVWSHNKAAKFLMPLLSKDKKQNVAQKFQEQAKSKGLAVPAILRDLDPKTGVPAVLKVTRHRSDDQAQLREAVTNAISHAAQKARSLHEPSNEMLKVVKSAPTHVAEPIPPIPPVLAAPPPPTAYDADTQTEALQLEDKQEQTLMVLQTDAQIQSDESCLTGPKRVDECCQTTVIDTADAWVQYEATEDEAKEKIRRMAASNISVETQTEILKFVEATVQTQEKIAVMEQAAQTGTVQLTEAFVQTQHATFRDCMIQTHVFELVTTEMQTEALQTKNQRLQTPVPETLDQESQTEPMTDSQAPTTSQKLGKHKMGLHDIIKKAMSNMQTSGKPKLPSAAPSLPSLDQEPEMANWADIEADSRRPSEEVENDQRRRLTIRPVGDRPLPPQEDDGPSWKLRHVGRPGASKRVRQNLRWDPVDGLHAEKQRRVSDLKHIFEAQERMKLENQGNEGPEEEEEEDDDDGKQNDEV